MRVTIFLLKNGELWGTAYKKVASSGVKYAASCLVNSDLLPLNFDDRHYLSECVKKWANDPVNISVGNSSDLNNFKASGKTDITAQIAILDY